MKIWTDYTDLISDPECNCPGPENFPVPGNLCFLREQ